MRNLSIALTLTLLFAGCSAPINVASRWRGDDQQQTEERGIYLKDQNIVVDLQNNDEYVYLTVGVSDRMKQRQIVFQGLTVWFDYQGGDAKRFGVHYPVGGGRPQLEGGRPDPERMRDTSWTFPDNFSDEIEILGPAEGEHHRVHLTETKGMDVKIENHSGTLVYSLKVPLTDNGQHNYGIGAHAGTTIGLGIETGGFTQGERGESPRGGGGRGRGGFGGRGRGGEGMPSEGFRSTREPIKFWAKVQLASQ